MKVAQLVGMDFPLEANQLLHFQGGLQVLTAAGKVRVLGKPVSLDILGVVIRACSKMFDVPDVDNDGGDSETDGSSDSDTEFVIDSDERHGAKPRQHYLDAGLQHHHNEAHE